MKSQFSVQAFPKARRSVHVGVMTRSPVLTLLAVALLSIAAFVASSSYAQNIIRLDPSSAPSAVPPGLDPRHAIARNSSDAFIIIPALPRRLNEKLTRDLTVHGRSTLRLDGSANTIPERNGNIGSQSQSSVAQGSNNDHISAGKARLPADAAHRYFVTDLGTLGGTQSFAYGINDSGQIVGFSWIAGDASGHSFLYSNGRMADLYPFNSTSVRTVGPTSINNFGQIASGLVVGGVYVPALLDAGGNITLLGSLGGATSFGFTGVATSVSNSGDVVGYSYIDATTRHAFLYFNGGIRDIGSFGGYSAALDVNDAGTIVGFSTNASNGPPHAFVYRNGVMKDIDPFSDTTFSKSENYARSINNQGQVVGDFLTADSSAFHAFLYSGGTFYDLGFPESPETVALSINDQGQVVGATLVPFEDTCFDPQVGGYVVCTNYVEHAFVYHAGNIADLNTLIPPDSGWELAWAFDINNHGQIVGYGLVNARFRAFVLTPADSQDQCKNDRWKNFGFKNQGQCIKFVNTGK